MTFLTLILPALAFCGQDAEIEPQKREAVRDVSVILIMQDGLPGFVFDRLLTEGRLPNIKQNLVERGCKTRRAFSPFPTVTFPAHLSSVTGLFPGHSSVPGLKWFNRERQTARHYLSFDFWRFEDDLALYSPKMAAIPRMMEKPESPFTRLQDLPTASVQQVLVRNAGSAKFFPLELALSKVMAQLPHKTDEGVAAHLKKLYLSDAPPRFSFVNFPDYDSIAHLKGIESQDALQTVVDLDRMLGEIIEVLKSRGSFEKTYIIFASDHGNTSLRNGNLTNYKHVLSRVGLKPQMRHEPEFDAYVAANSLNSVAIYIKDPKRGWSERPRHQVLRNYPAGIGRNVDLLKHVAEQDGTDFLIVGDGPGQVRVLNEDSEMLVTRRLFLGKEFYRARLLKGVVDPFRYLDHDALAGMMESGAFHPAEKWLEHSLQTRYPDALVQVVQIFDSFRCGDIFLCMREGWKCKPSRYVATHGSMMDSDTGVPLVISGPDIRHSSIPVARLVDVYPTILRLFGLQIPFGVLDGRPLDEILPSGLCRQTDPFANERQDHLPAMLALWQVEAAYAESPVLPHQFTDMLDKMPKGKRRKLARLLKRRRRRLTELLAQSSDAVFSSGDGITQELLRAREQETERQLELLEE
jgi:predicted AlkP superfamily pyrophosphatase or phosphodiesterase